MIQALLPLIGNVIDKVVPDKNANAKAKREIEKSLTDNANKILLAQTEINKVEASHQNLFVAGWRPAIGWSCALGVFWLFIGHPLATWIDHLDGVAQTLPTIDSEILLELVFAMLGIAGLRTLEKIKGLTK
tara:strand:+ start:18 stop:410 length:393 start_codon:yes stop_codon:yes gene_type:complete